MPRKRATDIADDIDGEQAIEVHLDTLLAERGMTLTELSELVGITLVNLSVLKCRRLCLVPSSRTGWFGGADVQEARSAYTELAGLGLGSVGFVFTEDGGVAVSVARPGIEASLIAQPLERAIIVEDRLPFGPGWISWRALPRLAVEGRLELLGHDHKLAFFSAYHDHNWGRWRWGDDAGWEWGAFLGERPGPAFVWSRPTNRAHTTGASLLTIRVGGQERRFSGPALRIERRGRWMGPLHPVPRGFGGAPGRPPFTKPPRARPDRFR